MLPKPEIFLEPNHYFMLPMNMYNYILQNKGEILKSQLACNMKIRQTRNVIFINNDEVKKMRNIFHLSQWRLKLQIKQL